MRIRPLAITPSPRALAALLALLSLVLVAALAGRAGAATVTVAPGETLGGIAARHGTDAGTLARLNGLADPDRIVAGSRLRLPGVAAAGPARPAASAPGGHVIRRGETLGAIAARHGVSVAALAAANGIGDPNAIVAGRRLAIPSGGAPAAAPVSAPAPAAGPGRHVVRRGETLGAIAARHGVSVAALAAANGIGDPNAIVAGRRLAIPSGGAPAAAPVSAPATGSGVRQMIDAAAARHGVDPALARAIAWQESGWNQAAVSHAGAVGVMQLMPATAAWLGSDVLRRPLDRHAAADNIEGGVAFLAWLMRRTGDTSATVGAYYQGLASLRRRGPYDDTRAYVRSVLALRGTV